MDTCHDHKGVIVIYEGRHCPICNLEGEKEDLAISRSNLETKVNELRSEVDSLKELLKTLPLEDRGGH